MNSSPAVRSRLSIYLLKRYFFFLIGGLIFFISVAPIVWAQETNDSASAIDGSPVFNFGEQGSKLYYLGNGDEASFVVGKGGKPMLVTMDNPGAPTILNGVPAGGGWYQIGEITSSSKTMTFFYSLNYKFVISGSYTQGSNPCHEGYAAWNPAPNYTIKITHDADGKTYFNQSYTDWYTSMYITIPSSYLVLEATSYYCGSQQITVPLSTQDTLLPGTYTLSWIDNHTNSVGGSITHDATATVPDPTPVGPTKQYTGQWIKSDENAWGLSVLMNFSDPSYIFVPWYTYDSSGKASWYLFQGSATDGNGKWTANDTFTANVFRYSGPTWGVPYDSSKWGGTQVGTATLKFIDPTTATFAYDVDNSSRSITLSKWDGDYPMGQYSGQWIKVNSYGVADEMGWGLTVLQTFHTPNTIFVPWYTYDASGNAQWYLFQGEGVPLPVMNTYQLSAPPTATNPSGGVTVCRFHGPSWGVFPYDNSQTEDGNTCTATGSATLTFTDQTHAVFQYNNVDGGSGTINLVKLQ